MDDNYNYIPIPGNYTPISNEDLLGMVVAGSVWKFHGDTPKGYKKLIKRLIKARRLLLRAYCLALADYRLDILSINKAVKDVEDRILHLADTHHILVEYVEYSEKNDHFSDMRIVKDG
jgi:hypothetical protein